MLEKAAQRDMLIIEDDFDCESNYKGYPHPALRGMDRENRVIYVSCLSKVLAPGLRLGFMVAAPELIAEARKLRRLMVGQPPRNNQRAMAHFIRLGPLRRPDTHAARDFRASLGSAARRTEFLPAALGGAGAESRRHRDLGAGRRRIWTSRGSWTKPQGAACW